MQLLILQQVADLSQQDLFSRRCGRCGRLGGLLFFLLLGHVGQLVQTLHQEEHNQSQNDEVDDGGDEVAVVQGVQNIVSGFVQNGLREQPGQDDLQLRKINAAHEDGNDGHDDVVGQRLGDGGESGTDDGTDSQCHGVTLNGKGNEFINPCGLFHVLCFLSI